MSAVLTREEVDAWLRDRGLFITSRDFVNTLDATHRAAQQRLVRQLDDLLAERDAARDIAARLEGELARVREIVTAWSLGQTHRDEMVLWAIRDIVGLTPAKPDNPTPWPHPDAVIDGPDGA